MLERVLLVVIVSIQVESVDNQTSKSRHLIWEENFDVLDTSKWEHDVTAWGGGNLEFQVYIPDVKNSYVKNGHLHIRPSLYEESIDPNTGRPYGKDWLQSGEVDLNDIYGRCTNDGNYGCFRDRGNIPPIASALLRSRRSFSFLYGTIEIRARMPGGDWMWPAIWLLPLDDEGYSGWPYGGEMDVVESLGNRNLTHRGQQIGSDRIISALHFCRSPIEAHLFTGTRTRREGSFADDFHVYTLDWTEEGFSYSMDGSTYLKIPNEKTPTKWQGFGKYCRDVTPWPNGSLTAPFDKKFYFVINVAVGSMTGIFPDDVVNHGGKYPKPWTRNETWKNAKNDFMSKRDDWYWTWFKPDGQPEVMTVDYIRVYDSQSFISEGDQLTGKETNL